MPNTSVGLGKPRDDTVVSPLYPNRRGWNANHTTHDEGTTSNPLRNFYIGPSIGVPVVLCPIYHRKTK